MPLADSLWSSSFFICSACSSSSRVRRVEIGGDVFAAALHHFVNWHFHIQGVDYAFAAADACILARSSTALVAVGRETVWIVVCR